MARLENGKLGIKVSGSPHRCPQEDLENSGYCLRPHSSLMRHEKKSSYAIIQDTFYGGQHGF